MSSIKQAKLTKKNLALLAASQSLFEKMQALRAPLALTVTPEKEHPVIEQLTDIMGKFGYAKYLIKGFKLILDTDKAPVVKSLSIASLALDGFNLLRLPLVYLAAWQLGIKIPSNAAVNARWIQSVTFLGLAIVALAVPATAPVIAFAAAGVTLAASVVTLGQVFYVRTKVAKALKEASTDLADKEREYTTLQDEVKVKEEALTAAVRAGDEEKFQVLAGQIDALAVKMAEKRTELQRPFDRKTALAARQERNGKERVAERAIGAAVASLALVGMVVTLFVPPVGAAILTSSAVIAGGWSAYEGLKAAYAYGVQGLQYLASGMDRFRKWRQGGAKFDEISAPALSEEPTVTPFSFKMLVETFTYVPTVTAEEKHEGTSSDLESSEEYVEEKKLDDPSSSTDSVYASSSVMTLDITPPSDMDSEAAEDEDNGISPTSLR